MSNNPPPTAAPTRRAKRDQDQTIADFITATDQMLDIARTDAEIAPLLAPRGYDDDKLGTGVALKQTLQDTFTLRQQAIGTQKETVAASVGSEATARHGYTDFRETARAIFKDSATRAALGVMGKVPDDFQRFVTTARASYDAALANPTILAALTQYGYPATTIQNARSQLDAAVAADTAQTAAAGAAMRATQQRDEAYTTLLAWVSQFKAIAKVALRGRADLLRKLGG